MYNVCIIPTPIIPTKHIIHHVEGKQRKTIYAISPTTKTMHAPTQLFVILRILLINVLIAFILRVRDKETPPSFICCSRSLRISRLLMIKAAERVKIAITIDNPPIRNDKQVPNMSVYKQSVMFMIC